MEPTHRPGPPAVPPDPRAPYDAIVVGGGVVGLCCALALARSGRRVALVERDRIGGYRGASWAAAGMLAATLEVEPGEEALTGLTRAALSAWPAFAQSLGAEIGLRTDGALAVAATRDDLERLRFTFQLQTRLGLPARWCDAAGIAAREPRLRPGLPGGIWSPEDGQVDNRALLSALAEAARQAGITTLEGREVACLLTAAGRAAGVALADGPDLMAPCVVVAAGAWSRALPGLPAGAAPPVRPVKGQMLAVRQDPAAPLVRQVLWAPRAYLVPRADGRLLIGATTEERGFDTQVTAGGVFALLEAAWRVVPALENLPLLESWAGLRPGSPDDAPIVGESPAVPGLILATGHHRNGVLLAPLTGEAVAALADGRDLDPVWRPFGPTRFAAPTLLESHA